MFRRSAALGLATLLVLTAIVPGAHAAHHPAPQVTNTGPSTYAPDGAAQSLSFSVANHASSAATYDRIDVFVSGADLDDMDFQATTKTGWTQTVSAAGDQLQFLSNGAVISAGTTETFVAQFVSSTTAAAGESATIQISAYEGGIQQGTTQSFSINWANRALVITPATIPAAAEPSTTTTFNVALNVKPASDVTVTLTASAAVTLDKASLLFTASNYNTPQAVVATPVNDDVDNGASRSATVTLASSSNAYPGKSIVLTVNDDDTNGITVGGGTPKATEGGATDTFTVALSAKPSGNVVLLLTHPAGEFTLSASSLTFSATNWNTAQTVTVTAIDDTEDELAIEQFDVTISVDDANSADEYDAVADVKVAVQIADDDGPGIIVEETDQSTEISEEPGAQTDTFTVRLAETPSASTTVTITVPDAYKDDLTWAPQQLVFSGATATQPKTVLLTATDDSLAEALEAFDITIKATGAAEYNGLEVLVPLIINDNDDIGITVTESNDDTSMVECPGAISNDICNNTQGRDEFTVVLDRQPSSNVVIGITPEVDGEVVLDKPTLTFTKSNWDTPRTVRVSALDDDDFTGHRDFDLIIGVVDADSDPAWHGMDDVHLEITVRDDEKTLSFKPWELETEEGVDITYDVMLTVAPTDDVVVTLDLPESVTANKDTLRFTSSNFATAQQVKLTPRDDSKKDGDRDLVIRHTTSSTDSSYDDATVRDLPLRVLEDDEFDLEEANRKLQGTLKVKRDGEENVLEWDVDVLDDEPKGIQVWRADSPFQLVKTLSDQAIDYQKEQWRDADNDAKRSSRYVITAYYGSTEELGFFQSGADLENAPGYQDFTSDDFDELGSSGGDEDVSGGQIALVAVVVALVIALIVVLVLMLKRRKRDAYDDEGDEWDFSEPVAATGDDPDAARNPLTADWAAAGWHVEKGPEAEEPETTWADEEEPMTGWSDAPVDPARAEARERVWKQAGWAPHEKQPEPQPWEDEPEPEWAEAEETHALTCPKCRHDFDVVGTRPLKTKCPNCGVSGVLR